MPFASPNSRNPTPAPSNPSSSSSMRVVDLGAIFSAPSSSTTSTARNSVSSPYSLLSSDGAAQSKSRSPLVSPASPFTESTVNNSTPSYPSRRSGAPITRSNRFQSPIDPDEESKESSSSSVRFVSSDRTPKIPAQIDLTRPELVLSTPSASTDSRSSSASDVADYTSSPFLHVSDRVFLSPSASTSDLSASLESSLSQLRLSVLEDLQSSAPSSSSAALVSSLRARLSSLHTSLSHSHQRDTDLYTRDLSSIQSSHEKQLKDYMSYLKEKERERAEEEERERRRKEKEREENERKKREKEREEEEKRKAVLLQQQIEEKKKLEEMEAKRAKEEAAKKDYQKEKKAATQPGQQIKGAMPINPQAGKDMDALVASLRELREKIGNVKGPAVLKVKIFINRTITQIAQTISSVQEKAGELVKKCNEFRPNPMEYSFCLELIASKLAGQAGTRVRLQNSSAFSFASVALNVALQNPPFNDLFIAAMAEKCIYIAPKYLNRKDSPSDAEYLKALGYEEVEVEVEGKGIQKGFETEEIYFERMTGYVCLYAAYVQLPVPNHPHGPARGWTWLARILNCEPRSATAAILVAFLSTAGFTLAEAFPRQMRKLLTMMERDFLPKLDKMATTPARKASATRLRLWLEANRQRLQVPEGRNMPYAQDSDASEQQVHQSDFRE